MGLLLTIILAKDYFTGQTLNPNWYSIVLFVVSFIIFIPLAVMVSFITRYASCYVVLKNYRFRDSFKLGITLFTKNWLISLEMALALILVSISLKIL